MNIKQTPLWKSVNCEKENYDAKYNRKVLDLRKTAEDDNQNTQQQVDNSQNQTQQVNNDVPNNNNPYAADSKTQNPYVTAKNENEKSAKEMYQNGLISCMAPREDYWDDNSSEGYYPHSDWIGPSGAIWTSMYGRY